MRSIRNLLFLVLLIMWSCKFPDRTLAQNSEREYITLKSEFDSNFVDQFPKSISGIEETFVRSKTNKKKNDIGFYLYAYELRESNLDSIEAYIKEFNFIGKYEASDSCLLIVNRFETRYTADNILNPEITDTSGIDKPCYEKLFPVPNFIDYTGAQTTDCNLDSTFTIYVLAAKSGKHFTKYPLDSFLQMPSKWANGYSKGIAISRINRTVIYWSILW